MLHFREALIGEDPTDVERCMLKIRQRGSFKPHGAAVSAIEHALWDIAGKAAGVPVYKLLGGKVRDQVRCYNGNRRRKRTGDRPEDYAADVKWMMEQPEGFFMVKQGIGFHSNMKDSVPDFHYGVDAEEGRLSRRDGPGADQRARHGAHARLRRGDEGGAWATGSSLALDCGPGWFLNDAIRFARAVEPYNLMWLEDMLTGDYVPWVNPQAYRELTRLDLDADPHRRADLPAAQLQGADRDPGGARRSAPIRPTSAASPSSNGWPSTPTCTRS